MAGTMVVPQDGSPLAEHALPCAARLARAANLRLVLVRAVPPGDGGALLSARHALHDLAARLRAEGLDVVVRVRVGDPEQVIDEEEAEWAPDVVVLSTHGASGMGRWLYGSVAAAVIGRARTPTLLVPSTCDHMLPADRPPHILCPLDGSPGAEAALDAIALLVEALDATVILLRVVEPPLPRVIPYGQGAPYVEFDPHVDLAAARAYLHQVAERFGLPPGRVQSHAIIGRPGVAIPLFAREQRVDLVVLTGRRTVGEVVPLGPAALGTLQAAGVPLLIVGETYAPAPAAGLRERFARGSVPSRQDGQTPVLPGPVTERT